MQEKCENFTANYSGVWYKILQSGHWAYRLKSLVLGFWFRGKPRLELSWALTPCLAWPRGSAARSLWNSRGLHNTVVFLSKDSNANPALSFLSKDSNANPALSKSKKLGYMFCICSFIFARKSLVLGFASKTYNFFVHESSWCWIIWFLSFSLHI